MPSAIGVSGDCASATASIADASRPGSTTDTTIAPLSKDSWSKFARPGRDLWRASCRDYRAARLERTRAISGRCLT
jgi:hypothetical protein